jgi:hypothetical protein
MTEVLLTGVSADLRDDGLERIDQGGDAGNWDGMFLGESNGSLKSIEAMYDSGLHGDFVNGALLHKGGCQN